MIKGRSIELRCNHQLCDPRIKPVLPLPRQCLDAAAGRLGNGGIIPERPGNGRLADVGFPGQIAHGF